MKLVQLLGSRGPWRRQVCRDTDCPRRRGHGPIRVFSRASCSWRSEGLFGQSLSAALPVQALRGIPCLGSVSAGHRMNHIDGPPSLGSYSVDKHVRHLKEHPGWGPALQFSGSGI